MKARKNAPSRQKPASTVSTWTYLSWFQVQYLSSPEDNKTARVFSNNRQQVHIEFIVQGRNANGEVTSIPPDDLRRLELVRYETGESLWSEVSTASSRDTRYDYYPESGVFPNAYQILSPTNTERHADIGIDNTQHRNNDTITNARTKTIAYPGEVGTQAQAYDMWISTSQPNTLRIAAKLTAPNGTIFHTHTKDAAPGGSPTGGNFNSSITLSPQMPRSFTAEYFNLSRRDEIADQYFDVDIYEIWFKDANYKIRDSINHTQPGDRWHYSYEKNSRNQYQSAYKADHSRLVRHAMTGAPQRYIEFLVNYFLASEGKATASRVTESMWLTTFNSGGPARIGYIDNFGNESIITLKPSADGNTMSIGE